MDQLTLASILTMTDADFAEIRGLTPAEEYLIFKVGSSTFLEGRGHLLGVRWHVLGHLLCICCHRGLYLGFGVSWNVRGVNR